MGLSISANEQQPPGDRDLFLELVCDTDHGFLPATTKRTFRWYPDAASALTAEGWMMKPGLVLCPECRRNRPDLAASAEEE